jgi:hypothetical protein
MTKANRHAPKGRSVWSRERRFSPGQINAMIEMFLSPEFKSPLKAKQAIRKKYLISPSHLQKILERKIYKDVKL